jgi:DNA-binding NarL/FixJ family response regulator
MNARVIILAADGLLRESIADRVRETGALVVARWSLAGWTVHDLQRLRPHVVLLARGETGECATLRTLTMAASLAPTIVFDDCRRSEWLARLLLCGAWGVAPAEVTAAAAAESLEAVLAGELAWKEGAASRAARAILQAHDQGQLAKLRPAAASTGEKKAATCPTAAQRLLLAQLASLPDRQTVIDLALALGLSLSELEARFDWIEQAGKPVAGPHQKPAEPVPRPSVQSGLRYLVSSLRALRHEA